jgi:hypothetical protein
LLYSALMTQETLLEINGIDIHGMSNEHRARIEQIGLWQWMREYNPVPIAVKTPKGDKRAQAAAIAERLCALGSKCLKAEYRRGFPVVGKGLYCSDRCAGRAKAIEKAEKKAARDAYLAEGGQILK